MSTSSSRPLVGGAPVQTAAPARPAASRWRSEYPANSDGEALACRTAAHREAPCLDSARSGRSVRNFIRSSRPSIAAINPIDLLLMHRVPELAVVARFCSRPDLPPPAWRPPSLPTSPMGRLLRLPGRWTARSSCLSCSCTSSWQRGPDVTLHLPGVHEPLNRLLGRTGVVNGAMYAVVAAVLLLDAAAGRRSAPGRRAPGGRLRAGRMGGGAAGPHLRTRGAAPGSCYGAAESRDTIPLRSREPRRPRPDLESQMLELVNAERRPRAEAGAAGSGVTQVARRHSRTCARGSRSARRRGPGRPPARGAHAATSARARTWRCAPAAPRTRADALPGHRANILRPQFGRLGIGILDGGIHGLMVTQAFPN